MGVFRQDNDPDPEREKTTAFGFGAPPPLALGGCGAQSSNARQGLRVEMTLEQACPPECWRAQCAFKDSMTHGILQFALLIAFRCVLHRCQNQEIRC
jgi:hypothetical protein